MSDIANGKEYGELHNAQFGTIRYPLGKTGKRSFGLLHIIEQRMKKDGATLQDAIDIAMRVGEAAEIGSISLSRYNTHHLDYNGVRAIIGKMPDNSIVITGYEIDADDSEVANRRTTDIAPQPHVRSEEVIRALKALFASAPNSMAYSSEIVNPQKPSIRYSKNGCGARLRLPPSCAIFGISGGRGTDYKSIILRNDRP